MTYNVLQTWVSECTHRQQGVLILSLRGPDGTKKESKSKPLVRTLRALVMNSGRERAPMGMGQFYETDSFMTMAHVSSDSAWAGVCKDFISELDEHNIHFVQHLIHAFAIVGIEHPNYQVRLNAWSFYTSVVAKLHLFPETAEQIRFRLRDGIREEEDE